MKKARYTITIKNEADYLIQINKLYLLGYQWCSGNPTFDHTQFPLKIWLNTKDKTLLFSELSFGVSGDQTEVPCKLLHHKQIKFLKNVYKRDQGEILIGLILERGFYEVCDGAYLNSKRRLHVKDEGTHTIDKTS
jgi:hypothetical protein